MNRYKYQFSQSKRTFAAALIFVFSVQVFAQAPEAVRINKALAAIEEVLTQKIDLRSIREMTTALSAAEMEGRGTGQPGGDKAASWIADRFKSYGLKPLGDKGSFLQKVEFKESVPAADTSFSIGNEKLEHGTDFAFLPQNNGNKSVTGDLVFVSYGLQIKQAGIDMIGAVNLNGKAVVMLEGPPPGIDEKSWRAQDAQIIVIGNMIRSGVTAIVFIGHGGEKNPPEELISYFSRRQLTLPDEKGYPAQIPPFIYVSTKGAEKLFANSGVTRRQALDVSATREFNAIDLKQKAKIVGKFDVKKVSGSNVVGLLEGSDPKLKAEAIVFSAHYDAYGKENEGIYYGAADNALGTSEMMAVAEAYSRLSQKPKRSMIFIAVTGEEYGLYGSKYWAKNPRWDVKKIAANLNLDGVGSEVYGPVKTIVGYGAEHSSLGAVLASVAESLGIGLIPDPMPDERIFYRSDHYSFVERGIPALKLLGAPAGEPKDWIKRMDDWKKTDYHQPGDTIQPNWAWEGPKTIADVVALLGWRISESEAMPNWLASSRFSKLERGNTKELPEEK